MYRKRERTQNWSLEEKMYLLQLVKARLDVLENKRIDSASSALKGMAWQDIHAAFAARFGNDRDAHRVREQWRRMKGQARTEMMDFAERVRNYGAEVANQRWPSALSEDVWKTLEAARKVDDYQQVRGHGQGEDAGSPITMDDEEEEADDMVDYGDVRSHDRLPVLTDRVGGVVKAEPADEGEHSERLGPGADEQTGFMSMLRPKVELSDVPDLDTSMVPSGLSITAVNIAGGGKKRLLDRQTELPYRNNHGAWDSPGPPPQQHHQQQQRTDPYGALPRTGGIGAGAGPGLGRAGTPQHPVLEGRRLEGRRRLEILEEEHAAKMALLRVEKETAEIRRRIALREEEAAVAAGAALACRTCTCRRSAGPAGAGRRGHQDHQGPHTTAKSDAGDDLLPDLDNDADASDLSPGSAATAATTARSPSVGDDASTDGACGKACGDRGVNGFSGAAGVGVGPDQE
ncbi:Fibrinogen silencer-binding protein [Frankliniella fusca]|uniref:Regulatory protein zeste n=1 Tax=Frankliniella fusca TaxID=407009 RepID=A0AAE1H1L0_9NEOP|nr:Fibrinogen silencer-binding protein [Frankliniella fusca]